MTQETGGASVPPVFSFTFPQIDVDARILELEQKQALLVATVADLWVAHNRLMQSMLLLVMQKSEEEVLQ